MALVVGPKQNVAPMKTSATSNDQLQQIVTWVSGQQDRDFGLDMVHFSQTGTSRKITVYTTKFASGGRFDTTGVSSPFSWSKDSRHTERWELWIIVSDCDEWYGHGEFNGDEDPDAHTSCRKAERDPARFCGREHLHGRHHIRQPARRGAVPPVLSHGLPNPAKRQRHLQHGRRNTGRVRQRGLEKRLRAGSAAT